MQEQVTNEFLAGMFHAYAGCDAIGQDARNTNFPHEKGHVVEVSRHSVTIESTSGLHEFALFECEPILTPLSEISDEDAVEVAKIAKVSNPVITRQDYGILVSGDNGAEGKRNHARTVRVYYRWSNTRVMDGRFEVIEYCLPIADYLRSRGYDLGFMHIPSLIEAGLAVKSEKK